MANDLFMPQTLGPGTLLEAHGMGVVLHVQGNLRVSSARFVFEAHSVAEWGTFVRSCRTTHRESVGSDVHVSFPFESYDVAILQFYI